VLVSKVPIRFAGTGILIGFILMGLYWYDYKYNPFHLPPPPPLYHFFEKCNVRRMPWLIAPILHSRNERSAWLGNVGPRVIT
jgi:hypothetical protein